MTAEELIEQLDLHPHPEGGRHGPPKVTGGPLEPAYISF